MKRIVALCLSLLMMIMTACQSSAGETTTSHKMITPPFDKLSWGMSQEEVLTALELTLDDVIVGNSAVWRLTKEQLGVQKVAGLDLSEEKIVLNFFEYKGALLLGMVEVCVHAESGAKVEESLTAAYDAPISIETAKYWISASPENKGEDSDFELMDEFERGSAFQLSGGEQRLYAILPLISVPGTVNDPFAGTGKTLALEAEDDFIIQFNAKTYLLSINGSK